MKKNRIQNNNIKEDNKIFLGKTSTIIILLVNIVLACFAILSYKSVGNQFSLSNRPFIGFENNGDKASQIIESIVYDNTPDIGVEFNSEDVGSGIILNLTLKNYGVLPAYFKMQPYSLIGDIQPFEENIDFIMPSQTMNTRWVYKWTMDVPDITKELLSFEIDYSAPGDKSNKYKTEIGTKFIKIPTKDEEEIRVLLGKNTPVRRFFPDKFPIFLI